MPKPAQGDWRSGAHINWSVQSTASPGKNLFKDEASGDWSETARWAAAGALKHGVALTAVNCPTVNSYKGLIGRAREFEGGTVTWAPTHITYGVNNRSAMIRVSAGPLRHREPRRRHVREPLSRPGHDLCCFARGHQRKARPRPAAGQALYELTAAERDELQSEAPTAQPRYRRSTGFAADPLAKLRLRRHHTGFTRCISRTSGIASTRRLPTGRSGNICGSSNLGPGPKRLALLTMSMLSPATSASRSAKLSVRGVGKRYHLGNRTTIEAVRDVSFDVTEGEICALLGPSGCGKSTMLRMVAGLEDPSTGSMFLDGKHIDGPDKSREWSSSATPPSIG